MGERVVSYLRVSTERQSRSGLGIEAQRAAISQYISSHGATLLQEFAEVETGKGSNALERRPKLREAIALAKKRRAVLIIAKLDRLARNVHFVAGLMETGVEFRCCDFPTANKAMVHIYAAMAEEEGRRISQRIKDALQAKKARGEAVGNPGSLEPHNTSRSEEARAFAERLRQTLAGYRAAKLSQRAMVDALNAADVPTARGGRWSLMQLQRVCERLGL